MNWEVVANSWQYTSIYGADGKRLFLMNLEDWGVNEENQEQLEKQQADMARLASAAPVLLLAAKDAAASLERYLNSTGLSHDDLGERALYALKDAIAKADGAL